MSTKFSLAFFERDDLRFKSAKTAANSRRIRILVASTFRGGYVFMARVFSEEIKVSFSTGGYLSEGTLLPRCSDHRKRVRTQFAQGGSGLVRRLINPGECPGG